MNNSEKFQHQEKSKQVQLHRKESNLHVAHHECPNCHRLIQDDYELCPYCRHRAHLHQCSFCGEPMEVGENFCGECGNPVAGIPCPKCGTLSFRSFCPNCNTAVNEQGQEALKAAYRDPKFLHAIEVAKELAEIEELLEQCSEEELAEANAEEEDDIFAVHINEEDMKLAARYRDMMLGVGGGDNTPQPSQSQEVKQEKTVEKKQEKRSVHRDLKLNGMSISDLTKKYKSLVKDINDTMQSFMPDAGTTPQIQRDYYSARQLPVIITTQKKERVKNEWVCNYCGCHHHAPSECFRPELGGTWIYEERTVTVQTKSFVDE